MDQRFSKDLLRTVASLPRLEDYCNQTRVVEIAAEELWPEDVLKASVVGALPALLVSGTGDGKSQVVLEIAERWFGGRATLLRGDGGDSPIKAFLRTDFRALFRREADNDEALVEPSEHLRYGLLFADELNRQLLTASQGEVLQLLDGRIQHRGRAYRLGTRRGYFTVIAAMNVGAAYVATSQLDEALRQRFPIVLDLDHFAAQPGDLARVRPPGPPAPESWLAEIENAWEELSTPRAVPTGLRLAATFIAQHLNRCTLLDRPKRTVTHLIPRLCTERGCQHVNRGCHLIDETPWRILLALERVTLALQAVAMAKAGRSGRQARFSIDGDVLDYLAVLGAFGWPVSSVLLTKHKDERSAHDYSQEIVGHVRESFVRHRDAILEEVTRARANGVDLGPWQPVVEALLQANRHASSNRAPDRATP